MSQMESPVGSGPVVEIVLVLEAEAELELDAGAMLAAIDRWVVTVGWTGCRCRLGLGSG
jgi:hypothetical protein